MDRIELHDVEYGDCTALVGRDQTVLMIDCGSVSQYTRQDNTGLDVRFDAVFRRYAPAKSRYFLLTHYHRDHLNGFVSRLKSDPLYFDRVYIPVIPQENGRSPLLELAVYAHLFTVPQSGFALVNTACLTVFELLQKTVGTARICTLSAGDVFTFDGDRYEVLSPGESFSYDERLYAATASLNGIFARIPGAAAFLHSRDAFIKAYHACQKAFSPAGKLSLSAREELLCTLFSAWQTLEAQRDIAELLSAAEQVRDILSDTTLRALYTETQNDLSVVFQDKRLRGASPAVLFTGDASDKVLSTLSTKLYNEYFAVKAPHHGTESHWSPVFSGMEVAHWLISNGDYHAGSAVSGRYIAAEGVKHCTNRWACPWYKENESCCNRLLRCWEQPASGALTLKCIAAAGNRHTPCNIYVFGHNGVRSCHCDRA